jgi:hypothetical protein
MNISSNIGFQSVDAYQRWVQPGVTLEPKITTGTLARTPAVTAPVECQTCKNRTYVDGSNDPSVSFKTPTNISPSTSFTAVRAHEQEHVVNENSKAAKNGGRVVSQNVALHYAVCPECGRAYVAGGTTTTVTKYGADSVGSRGAKRGAFAGTGQIVDARI